MRFGLLGGLEIHATDGSPVDAGGPVPRLLLVALLAAEGRTVAAERLIEILWAGQPPPGAAGRLRSEVSQLRRILEPDHATGRPWRVLVSQPPGYRLDVAADDVDLRLFTRLADEGRLLLDADELAQAREVFGRALDLWRGDAFAQFADLDVAAAPAARLEDRRLAVLEDRVETDRRLGGHAVLESRSRAQDRTLAALVGRQAEVAQLRALLGETLSGASRFALLEGEPGIGKTRLQEEVAAWAAADGATVVWGRCHEGVGAPAFWPWLELLRRLLDALPPAERRAAVTPAVAQLLDATGSGPQGPPGSGVGISAAPYAVFGSVAAVLETVARRGPLVVLIDDLQWADPASAELLEFLAQQPSQTPVLVVGSLRELELGRNDAVVAAVAAVTRRSGTRRLLLSGLDLADTAALMEQVAGVAPSEDGVADVFRRAQGNPFFVTELARLMASAPTPTGSPALDGWATGAGLPAGVRDVVRLRVARLPEATIAALQVAAVIGCDVEVGLLATVVGSAAGACLDGLAPALAHQLLVPGERQGTVRFAHSLVRDAVLVDVPPLRLARLNSRVADAIEASTPDHVDVAELLAEHRWHAVPIGEGDRAATALERAAGVAVRRFAYETADALLERALELRRAANGTPHALEAELSTIGLLIDLRRDRHGYAYERRDELFARAERLARTIDHLAVFSGLLWAEWSAAATMCEFEVSESLARQMLELATDSDAPSVQLLGHYAWGVQCWHAGRLTESRAHLQIAVDLLRRDVNAIDPRLPYALRETDALIDSCYGMVVALTGDADRATSWFTALRREFRDPVKLMTVDVFEALAAAAGGDVATAARAGASADHHDPGGGMDVLGAAGQVLWGWAVAEQGQVEAGLALVDVSLGRFQATGRRGGLGLYLALRARALLLAGRFDEALEVVVVAETEVETSRETWPASVVQVVRAQVEHALGAPDEVVRDLLLGARAVALDQGQGLLVRRAELAARDLELALS